MDRIVEFDGDVIDLERLIFVGKIVEYKKESSFEFLYIFDNNLKMTFYETTLERCECDRSKLIKMWKDYHQNKFIHSRNFENE